ncbi:MAG: hypothetical protein KJ587_13995, partial [Alphaproteobacteria bacterium]|nr:hypothetical protein [Alphaproteobacteria bacterium]
MEEFLPRRRTNPATLRTIGSLRFQPSQDRLTLHLEAGIPSSTSRGQLVGTDRLVASRVVFCRLGVSADLA